jgi:CheY-like chemotaxis protein
MSDRVLIVEDDADIRDAISEALEDHGYRGIAAENGEQALRALRANSDRPCVILLDVMMPVMDGWQFRAEQSRDAELGRIPVIVLTAHANADEVATRMGATGFLKKPVQLERLIAEVRKFCAA